MHNLQGGMCVNNLTAVTSWRCDAIVDGLVEVVTYSSINDRVSDVKVEGVSSGVSRVSDVIVKGLVEVVTK